MPVNIDASGRRWVQAEVEVPGTPEEVWQAIATGPGISAWFVPTQLEERAGGTTTSDFGPGMQSQATLTAWEPPHRFAAEGRDGPDDPTVATEWTVETRAGGTCTVRVVHSWFSSSADWDDQFEGHTYGWQSFFRVLRTYLTHFRNQVAVPVQLMAVAPEPASEAWHALAAPLGLEDAQPGQRVQAQPGAPELVGVVEHAGQAPWFECLMRLDRPAPAIAHFVPHAMFGQVYVTLRFYFYDTSGERAASAARATESAWRAWLAERFALADAEANAA